MVKHKIAVIGAGVSGCSTALALLEAYPDLDLTIFSDKPFEKITSFGPVGIFVVKTINQREYAKKTFARYEKLYKTFGADCGLQLISGYTLSDDIEALRQEEQLMLDCSYGFQWLKEMDLTHFVQPKKYGLFYTTFTSEGRKYVPWLRKRLVNCGAKFEPRKIGSLDWLGNDYDFVINCAGLGARVLANDEDLVPIRGVLIELEAPEQKHFIYYTDDETYILPSIDSTFIGTVRQTGRYDMAMNNVDREAIWGRVLAFMPTLKNKKVKSEWVGLRPHRESVRVEVEKRKSTSNKNYTVIHNYGHSSNGFVLSWGCAQKVADLFGENVIHYSQI